MSTNTPPDRRLRLLHGLTIAYAVLLTLLLWLPDPRLLFFNMEPGESVQGYSHLITFGFLGFLVELGRRKKSIWFWGAVLVAYTLITEIVQELAPTPRAFEWRDVVQDLLGIMLGLFLAVVAGSLWRRTFPKHRNKI